MQDQLSGDLLQSYLASDDLTTAVEVVLKDLAGNAVVLGSGERLWLTDVILNNGATASVITIFQDANGDGNVTAGEEIYRAACAVNSTNPATSLRSPIATRRANATAANRKIKAKASAASVGTTVICQWRRTVA